MPDMRRRLACLRCLTPMSRRPGDGARWSIAGAALGASGRAQTRRILRCLARVAIFAVIATRYGHYTGLHAMMTACAVPVAGIFYFCAASNGAWQPTRLRPSFHEVVIISMHFSYTIYHVAYSIRAYATRLMLTLPRRCARRQHVRAFDEYPCSGRDDGHFIYAARRASELIFRA